MAALVSSDPQSKLAQRSVKDIYPVSRLVKEVRLLLDGSFPLLWVEGEISNLAMPGSGHIYFTLKDAAAQVRCAMFRGRNQQLRFTPENGMQVLLRVKVTMYEGRGEFQLIVEHMEPAGSGALQRAYEALKNRLGQEGLFDNAHKKSLPLMPQTIGIVSSPDGAAVHDILSVLKRRFPAANIILYPVPVQGETAPALIADAIKLANQRHECDVMIVGRGGGSLEDLWAFNDERVARAIFASKLPVISAVGHEIDFSIADFVADVRAPTPSAAAELAVPDANQLKRHLQQLSQRLNLRLTGWLAQQHRHLRYLTQRLPKPQQQIRMQQQLLARIIRQKNSAMQRILQAKQQQTDYLAARLQHPQAQIERQQRRLDERQRQLMAAWQRVLQRHSSQINQQTQQLQLLQNQLHKTVQARIQNHRLNLAQQVRTLAAVSPLNTLDRGYSITSDLVTGSVVTSSQNVEIDQTLNIRLHQGQIQCLVTGKQEGEK
ncbi:exodeoxyribonuclease VII large subunit [Methylophaga sp. OBS3]|uniref:exodeoxyribonuclease VII large subunit n=1 Tax=Methylophaga sp. OBS3 TaxID=2991934 RepID=UPI0022552D73|nr:exodeoxyribonuclease VII large subunit [Methylophaga sp. OBS3]MCX4190556.1 exodeoxyribonuclease VII large subunit [Methylophaga sp. OBS3]